MAGTGYDQYLTQSQQLRQQQLLAPQLRQSLELLQTPALELRALIRRELEKNPTLEEDPGRDTPLEIESAGADNATPAPDEKLELNDGEYERLARVDDDWREFFQQAGAARPAGPEAEERRQFMLDSLTQSATLQAHLNDQLGLLDLGPDDRGLAAMLIGCINDDGYLKTTLGELAETTDAPPEALERALRAVQELDPIGVGARDLPECLLLQMNRLGPTDTLAERMVRHHLEDLAAQRHADIAAALGVPVRAVYDAAVFIATLEPKPGRAFSADAPAYITPEVSVQRVGDEWVVQTDRDQLPHLRISKHYRRLMEDPATPPETRQYIREKIAAGAQLLKAIRQRQQTLGDLAREIVRVQADFFEHGVSHLKPLVMADVAKKIGVHETTVSRAVNGKYLQTPRGVYELKYFFTPGYTRADGVTLSNRSVKETIRQLIAAEAPAQPLSDQEIMRALPRR